MHDNLVVSLIKCSSILVLICVTFKFLKFIIVSNQTHVLSHRVIELKLCVGSRLLFSLL